MQKKETYVKPYRRKNKKSDGTHQVSGHTRQNSNRGNDDVPPKVEEREGFLGWKGSHTWNEIRKYLEDELGQSEDIDTILEQLQYSNRIFKGNEVYDEWDAPDVILDTYEIHSGGGMYHIFLQTEDKRWIGIHPAYKKLTITSEPFESPEDLYETFYEDWEKVTGLTIGNKDRW